MCFDVFFFMEIIWDFVFWDVLDLDVVFYIKDLMRLNCFGVIRYIFRVLQKWLLEGEGMVEYIVVLYKDQFFGICIIFEFGFSFESVKIIVVIIWYVEKQFIRLKVLVEILGLFKEVILEIIDILNLSIVQQLYDSVCLVCIYYYDELEDGQKLWIFKVFISNIKYLVCELCNFLFMEFYLYVVLKLKYLVIKYCCFGGKMVVVGFIILFYVVGSFWDMIFLFYIYGFFKLEM